MKICPKCNRTFEDSFSFCLEDGSVLSSSFNEIEPETIIQSRTQNDSSLNESKPNLWKLAFVILVSVFGIGFVAILLYLSSERKQALLNQNNDTKDYNSISNNSFNQSTQIISNSISQSPTIADNSAGNSNLKPNVNNTVPSPTKTPISNNTNSVLSKLRQGMSYAKARKMLINSGWQAVVSSPNREFFGSEEYIFNTLKFYEVESCSGTGMGFCRFLFRDINKKKLVVVTANNEEGIKGGPIINNWFIEK